MRILILIAMLAISLSAQIDDYGTKPQTKERREVVVKFHVALELLSGKFNQEQKEVLLQTIADPKSFNENNLNLFTRDQAKQIFFAIDKDNVTKFRTAYKMPVLADKRLYFVSLDKPGRAEAWRGWFAHIIATKTLTAEQIDELIRISDSLDRQDKSELDTLSREIEPLFDKTLAREIFASIGPYTTLGTFCKGGPSVRAEGGDCVCAMDHWNYSCNDGCSGGSGCTTTDGGCGMLWLFNCTGHCQISGFEIVQ